MNNKVYYHDYSSTTYAKFSTEVLEADVSSFEILDKGSGQQFARDYAHFFVRGKILSNFDHATGMYLGNNHLKDKNHVYFYNQIILGADPSSSQSIANGYIKDKSSIFCATNKIENADPITFEIIDKNYNRDQRYLFFENKIVKGFDPSNFKYVKGGPSHRIYNYISDGKVIVFDNKTINHVDISSWEHLGGCYSKDAQFVYYKNQKIPDADPESFKASHSHEASDKNYQYKKGIRLN